MPDDLAFFGPTVTERHARLRKTLHDERAIRVAMLKAHPEREGYWHDRIDSMNTALADLDAIWAARQPTTRESA